jgi:hypothetical protein
MAGLLLYPPPQQLAEAFIIDDFSFRYIKPSQAEVFAFVKEFLTRLQLFYGDESILENWKFCLQMAGIRYMGRAMRLGVSTADVVKFTTDDNGIVDALNSAANGHSLGQPCSLCHL